MFDTIRMGAERVEVHEHRAPSDESIRLYHDLLEKARKEVLGSFVVQDNLFSGAVVEVGYDPPASLRKVYVMFRLNGERHVVETAVDEMQLLASPMSGDRVQVIGQLCRTLGDHIAQTLRIQLVEKLKIELKEHR